MTERSYPEWIERLQLKKTVPAALKGIFMGETRVLRLKIQSNLSFLRVIQLLRYTQEEELIREMNSVRECSAKVTNANQELQRSVKLELQTITESMGKYHRTVFRQMQLKALVQQLVASTRRLKSEVERYVSAMTSMRLRFQGDPHTLSKSAISILTRISVAARAVTGINLTSTIRQIESTFSNLPRSPNIDRIKELLKKLKECIKLTADISTSTSMADYVNLLDYWKSLIEDPDSSEKDKDDQWLCGVVDDQVTQSMTNATESWLPKIQGLQNCLEKCTPMLDSLLEDIASDSLLKSAKSIILTERSKRFKLIVTLYKYFEKNTPGPLTDPQAQTLKIALANIMAKSIFVARDDFYIHHKFSILEAWKTEFIDTLIIYIKKEPPSHLEKLYNVLRKYPHKRLLFVGYKLPDWTFSEVKDWPDIPICFGDFDSASQDFILSLKILPDMNITLRDLFKGEANKMTVIGFILKEFIMKRDHTFGFILQWIDEHFVRHVDSCRKLIMRDPTALVVPLLAHAFARERNAHKMVLSGDIRSLKVLLTGESDANLPDSIGRTALHLLCWCTSNKLAIADALLPCIENVNKKDKVCNFTAAHYIDLTGDLKADSVDLQLINKILSQEQMSIFFAVAYNLRNTLKFLLTQNPNLTDLFEGHTAGHFAIFGNNVSGLKLLLDNGLDVNSINSSGETLLFTAASCNTFDIGKLLLSRNASYSADGDPSPLHMAVHTGSVEMTKLLLECGADPNANCHCHRYFTDIGELFLSFNPKKMAGKLPRGNSPKSKNSGLVESEKCRYLVTPLHIAAWGGHTAIAELLLEYGADPDAEDSSGTCVLHLAATRGHLETVKVLVHAGASLLGKTKSGHMPSTVAELVGEWSVYSYLKRVERSVSVKKTDY